MQYFTSLLAVGAVVPAAAFQAGAASKKASTSLASSMGPETDYVRRTPVTIREVSNEFRNAPTVANAINTPVKNVNNLDIWDAGTPVMVQGGSLKTFSFAESRAERVSVELKTEGRPLNCNMELWQGPDNTPYKVDVYLEDGDLRPFKAILDIPGGSNSIAMRNTGQLEFPFSARVETTTSMPMELSRGRVIQGGAVQTFPFDPSVESVAIKLQTDGRPMTARVELMQGPYNDKQVMEIYIENGQERTFFAVIETPGVGNVVRLVNTATVEFPLTAAVEPYKVDEYYGQPY